MRKIMRWMGWLLLFLLTLWITCYTYAFFARLPLDEQRNNITIYDSRGQILYESNFKKQMSWTDIEDIPRFLQDAFVAVEDKRFYLHPGFDPLRITKALVTNITHGDIRQGGSTITQQYAKNLFLTNEQTLTRKTEEFFYAARLEMQYSKSDILEGYLNTIYFGHGVYGIQAAAQYFFAKDVDALSIGETAMLVGIPNGPSLYSPYLHPDSAAKRQQLILDILYDSKLISEEEKNTAKQEALTLADHTDEQDSAISQYYIDAVIQELASLDIDMEQDLHVYTYYDPQAQQALQKAIHTHLDTDSELETAAIITQPFTGGILALAGGKDYTISQYNRAFYAKRQVASTIKPLLYYCALQQGFTPATQFLSQKTSFRLANNEIYAPTNYDDQYANANISMINAIALSDNIYAVKTHLFLGEETLHQKLLEFGITQSEANASEALGTVSMSLAELSRIYMPLASEGLYAQPTLIRTVTSDEKVLHEHSDPKQLFDRDDTLILSQMLTATFDIRNKGHTFPSMYGHEAKTTMAAKSGTSNWDSLVMAYNPEYIIGVWCGFDDNRELDTSYYTTSKLIFRDTINALYAKNRGPWYQLSDQIVAKTVDPITGADASEGSVYWFRKNE